MQVLNGVGNEWDKSRCPRSGGIVFIEMLALQMENRSNQEFTFLCIHPDETTVKAKRVRLVVNGINPQHFKIGLEGFLVGQQ